MNKKIKIIMFWLLLTVGIILGGNKVEAASASISANKTTVNVGDSITVTLRYTAAAWDLHVSSGLQTSSSTDFASASDDAKNISASKTIIYKASKSGTYTVSLSGTVSDQKDDPSSSGKSVGGKITVTVKAKSSSSSNSSSSGSNTTTPTKPTFSSVNQTVYANSEVNVRASYSTGSSRLGTLQKGDSVRRIGVATKSVDEILWSKVTYNGQTGYISSSFLTTAKPDSKEEDKDKEKESSNNKLKTLNVVPAGLTPNFDKETTNYKLTVGAGIDTVKVDAIADDKKAKVEVFGNTDLKIGENTITIKVTAEDKSIKTYKIVVTKEKEEQLGLKELLIEGLPLTPEFDATIYEYTLNLDKNDISELNITATPTRENATVEITGNADLKAGENIVTILVRDDSSDEEEIVTYQVKVNLPESVVETNSIIGNIMNNDLYKYILIGAITLVIIIIVIIIIASRRGNDDNFEQYYGEYNLQNDKSDKQKTENEEKVEMGKLSEEDLPKSLRKNKEESHQEEPKKDKDNSSKEEERKRKIDAITSDNLDDFEESTEKRKRGKHF